jgi:hypothetical protein
MLGCLVYLIGYVIVALIVLWIIETLVAMFLPMPPNILTLIRLLMALLVLIAALECFGILGTGMFPRGGPFWRERAGP